MINLVADVFSEIADFLLDFWINKIINRFTSKK